MNPFHNIDPALLDNSTTPNPLTMTNQFVSQDGSATDGNSMPAGELAHCSASLFSQPLSLLSSGSSLQIWVMSGSALCPWEWHGNGHSLGGGSGTFKLRHHAPGFCELVRHLIIHFTRTRIYFKYSE
jgi:hypothetical protein